LQAGREAEKIEARSPVKCRVPFTKNHFKPQPMKQYFFKVVSDYWTEQNRLQEEAKAVARAIDQIAVPEENMDYFLEHNLYFPINQLNAKHNRCKPLRIEIASSYTHSETEETYIIPGVFHLTRYLIKNHL
jgi:hypothetical protein